MFSELILFVLLLIGVVEFFTHFRIERVEETPQDSLPGNSLIVEADNAGELVDALLSVPRDTAINNLWIVPHDPYNDN